MSFDNDIYLVPRPAVGCALYRCPFFHHHHVHHHVHVLLKFDWICCLIDKRYVAAMGGSKEICPLRERSERVGLSTCVKHGHGVKSTNCYYLIVFTLMFNPDLYNYHQKWIFQTLMSLKVTILESTGSLWMWHVPFNSGREKTCWWEGTWTSTAIWKRKW